MIKLAEQLRVVRVFNNYEILVKFGSGNDVAIDYRCPPRGRLGWADCSKSTVWSARNLLPGLEIDGLSRTASKEFVGRRAESLPKALAWAKVQTGHEYVPSPFGGYIPKHVLEKCKQHVT